eukprot:scaffold85971_cov43-Tisochrysis_lutea.AAC.1
MIHAQCPRPIRSWFVLGATISPVGHGAHVHPIALHVARLGEAIFGDLGVAMVLVDAADTVLASWIGNRAYMAVVAALPAGASVESS